MSFGPQTMKCLYSRTGRQPTLSLCSVLYVRSEQTALITIRTLLLQRRDGRKDAGLSLCLSFCPSISLYVCLPLCPSPSLSVRLPPSLSVRLSVCLSVSWGLCLGEVMLITSSYFRSTLVMKCFRKVQSLRKKMSLGGSYWFMDWLNHQQLTG